MLSTMPVIFILPFSNESEICEWKAGGGGRRAEGGGGLRDVATRFATLSFPPFRFTILPAIFRITFLPLFVTDPEVGGQRQTDEYSKCHP